MGRPIVIFDDSCKLCRTAVSFAARRDDGQVRYIPSSNERAKQELVARGLEGETAQKSLVLLREGDVLLHSNAVLGLLDILRVPHLLMAPLRLVPKPIRDGCYDLISRYRYRLFGRR